MNSAQINEGQLGYPVKLWRITSPVNACDNVFSHGTKLLSVLPCTTGYFYLGGRSRNLRAKSRIEYHVPTTGTLYGIIVPHLP